MHPCGATAAKARDRIQKLHKAGNATDAEILQLRVDEAEAAQALQVENIGNLDLPVLTRSVQLVNAEVKNMPTKILQLVTQRMALEFLRSDEVRKYVRTIMPWQSDREDFSWTMDQPVFHLGPLSTAIEFDR